MSVKGCVNSHHHIAVYVSMIRCARWINIGAMHICVYGVEVNGKIHASVVPRMAFVAICIRIVPSHCTLLLPHSTVAFSLQNPPFTHETIRLLEYFPIVERLRFPVLSHSLILNVLGCAFVL